jgi:predicted DNA binding CopG/RHH family protein
MIRIRWLSSDWIRVKEAAAAANMPATEFVRLAIAEKLAPQK